MSAAAAAKFFAAARLQVDEYQTWSRRVGKEKCRIPRGCVIKGDFLGREVVQPKTGLKNLVQPPFEANVQKVQGTCFGP